jgi:DNA modification methylase
MFHWYFKLFNNIKSEQEANEFARLELEGLFGEVEPIYNFCDKLKEEPLSLFCDPMIRLQDFITHELPYGKIQGYFGTSQDLKPLEKLVKRLAYIREIYLISTKENTSYVKSVFPNKMGKIYHFFEKGNLVCFRFITFQYFLEKSGYISKLSRNEKEVDRNVEILFSHPIKNLYRIPASSTLSIGKRLEDYFAIREEPSLYLTHYFHPYKGKFHPKMARALINCVCPYQRGVVMDNFSGSGTSLVEASLMELDSVGIEINPLSVLMSNVKCNSLLIDIGVLNAEIEKFLKDLREAIAIYFSRKREQLCFIYDINFDVDIEEVYEDSKRLSIELQNNSIKNKEEVIPQVLICKKLLSRVNDEKVHDFLLLVLSGTISDLARRTKEEFQAVFSERAHHLYLRLYLFKKLNEILGIKVGQAVAYEGDARDMANIESETIDGILTSPPYSVAIDYIKNDYPQLVLLEMTDSIENLEKKVIGNPRLVYGKKVPLSRVEKTLNLLSESGSEIVKYLINRGKQEAGVRSYKFFIDMYKALREMHRVLKIGSKCAIVIGNNHFKVGNAYIEVPNDRVVVEIATKVGFVVDKFISRKLQKSSEGNIREESVIILKKED